MTTILGCIADDFTGATDLAGLLARSGVPVSLRIGVPPEPPTDTAAFEVIALKVRNLPAREAVSECRTALDWLQRAGAQRFYWKYCSTFDSTPDGNIGPVSEALMAALGIHQTVYCPAFPENGRSVFMGNLFVGREPLAESPMKDHPLTPMRDSNLMRLLEPQVTKSVGLIDRLCVARGPEAILLELTRLSEQSIAHVVIDAVAQQDLDAIATACRDMRLMTGGSALAMPLPALYKAMDAFDTIFAPNQPPEIASDGIILSGSCSAMTNAQVAQYLATGAPAYRIDPLTLAKQGPQAILDWLVAQDLAHVPLVYATAEPDAVRAAQNELGRTRAGEIVEEALAACAIAARDAGARRIVVAGGETSGAVTKALDVDRLDIGKEIAPGVPWTFCVSNGYQLALALKSGNFGAESFFTDALSAI